MKRSHGRVTALLLSMLLAGAARATELERTLGAPPGMPFAEEFDCVSAFDLFASFAMVRCAGIPAATGDADLLARALRRLQQLEPLDPALTAGLEIRFCPLLNGTGLVPAPNRMLLDDGLRVMSADGLAEIIAHEFVHVAQFERLGRTEFKCAYVRAMSVCGGCQDRGHPLEREAYDTQDRVRAGLARREPVQDPAVRASESP